MKHSSKLSYETYDIHFNRISYIFSIFFIGSQYIVMKWPFWNSRSKGFFCSDRFHTLTKQLKSSYRFFIAFAYSRFSKILLNNVVRLIKEFKDSLSFYKSSKRHPSDYCSSVKFIKFPWSFRDYEISSIRLCQFYSWNWIMQIFHWFLIMSTILRASNYKLDYYRVEARECFTTWSSFLI